MKSEYLDANSKGRSAPCTYTSLFRQVSSSGVSTEFISRWRDYVHFPSTRRTSSDERGSGRISVNNPVVVVPITPRNSTDKGAGGEALNAILVSGAPLMEVLNLIAEFSTTEMIEEGRASENANVLASAIGGSIPIQAPAVPIIASNNSNYAPQYGSSSSSSSGMPVSIPLSAVQSSVQEPPPRINLPLSARPSSAARNNGSSAFLPKSLFDTLDTIVYNYLEELLWNEFRSSAMWEKYWQFLALAENNVTEEDFSIFRVLGRGGFGLVSMCKRAQSGKLFAMKVMSKKRVKMKKSEASCLNERNLLAAVDSPFVVCLKFAFTTATDLYLIVDLMMGGDLGFHLHRKNRFPLNEAKYFAARTLMGVLALHDKDIIYRDLKPENILMDNDGYTRISDLGLATYITKNGLTGTCGTRGYWPPEMLRRDAANKREKYHKQADFFSFGCVVYEFIVGCSPFRTLNARQWKLENYNKATKDEK